MSSGAKGLIWPRLRKHKLAVISIGVVTLMGVACLAAPLLAPYDFDEIDLSNIRAAPSAGHLMGTDGLGRDLLTRILFGGRISILIGLFAAIIGTGFGSFVGSLAGYYGGKIDNLLMRFTDVVYAIPTLPLLIVLASYTAAGAVSMALAIGGLSWMTTARVVRGEVLSIREMEYPYAHHHAAHPPERTRPDCRRGHSRSGQRDHHGVVVVLPGARCPAAYSYVGEHAHGRAVHHEFTALAFHLPRCRDPAGRARGELHWRWATRRVGSAIVESIDGAWSRAGCCP